MELATLILAIINALIKGGQAGQRIADAWAQNAEMTPEQTTIYNNYRQGVYHSGAMQPDADK